MLCNADKIVEELQGVCPRERTPAVKERLRDLKARIDKGALPAKEGYQCLKKVVKAINKENLQAGRFEDALEVSQEGLRMFEDESLRVTVFMSLDFLGMKKHAKTALENGLAVFPNNAVLLKHKRRLDSEVQGPREEILGVRPDLPPPPPAFPGAGLPPGAPPSLSPDHLKAFENLDDNQLNSMFAMSKNMNMKEQFRSMYGRDISEDEARRMESMMTPQNFKMAMSMLKSNPDLLNRIPQGMGGMPGMPGPIGPPPSAFTPTPINQTPGAPQPLQPTAVPPSMPPMPPSMPPMPPGMPSMDTQSLMQNKDTIKMALRMLKDNPRMILEMLAGMGMGDRLSGLQNMSESRLKMLANFIYYAAVTILEAVAFFRRYKAQLLLLLIALVVYRYIL